MSFEKSKCSLSPQQLRRLDQQDLSTKQSIGFGATPGGMSNLTQRMIMEMNQSGTTLADASPKASVGGGPSELN